MRSLYPAQAIVLCVVLQLIGCSSDRLVDPTNHGSSPSTPSVTVAIDTSIGSGIPTRFELVAPYPNPSDGSVAFQFSLPYASFVVIVIQNPVGDVIIPLVTGTHEAGYYSVHWDGRNPAGNFVRNGDYFITMQSGSFLQSRVLKIER